MLPHFEKHIIEERKGGLKNIGYMIYSFLDHQNELVKAGNISLEDAQVDAIDHIKHFRYGPEFKDFIWLHDMEVSMIMHPYRPDLDGKDLSHNINENGHNLTLKTVELIKKQGEGYIEYLFQRNDDPTRVMSKVTFVKGYLPWGWIIGTGLYIEDVKAQIALVKHRMIWTLVGILMLVLLLQSKLIYQNIRLNQSRFSAEKKLRKSENRFKELAELLPQMVFEMDLNGNITFANHYASEFTGYSRNYLSNDFHVAPMFSKEDYLRVKEKINWILAGNKPYGSEYKLIKKNGEKASVHIYSNAIIQNNKPVGIRGIIIDITEYKKLQEQGQRAQRLEVAGRIAGQVAHDFNNLLGPLMAYPELIKKTLADDHPALNYINKIETASEYIAEINQQLLTLSRRGHYNQTPMDINEVVNNVINQIQPVSPKVELNIKLVENPKPVKGGAAQINRILLNLVSNAVEAVNGDGTISVTTENYFKANLSGKNHKVPKGDYVKITISDTGQGIPSDVLPKIFDPFFTTKLSDKKRGSGLGLTVVHSIMEDHGGFIDYTSEINIGTTFFLYFPITQERLKSSTEQRVVGGNESILVVDDDEMQREVTTKLLDNLGYGVMAVDCGEKALEIMKSQTFDLILLDMIMPGHINGAETYKMAIDINPNQKAIIVSGYAENEQVQQALDLGAGAFIKKPLTLKSLALAVRSELDGTEPQLQKIVATKSVLGCTVNLTFKGNKP